LENIAFFSIRRYASICGSRVYEQAMKQMPLTSELRPFYDFKWFECSDIKTAFSINIYFFCLIKKG
jgi:hypothetical protein